MLNTRPPSTEETIAGLPRLMEMGRGEEAEATARALQRQFPERGDVNEALALVLVNLGKPGHALSFAEAAVKAEPRNAGYLINLGRLYLDFELIEEASPVLEKALRINPKLYQAPWALGQFFHKTGNGPFAIRYLKQALAAAPEADRGAIERLLADALSSSGEIDEAERRFHALSSVKKHRAFALAHMAGLRRHEVDSPIFQSIQEELHNASLRPGEASNLHLALGRIYENSKDYRAAFEHFEKSKTGLERKSDLSRFRNKIDRLIEHHTPDVLEPFVGYGDGSDVPVFVVGMPRSGTTMTEQIIAAHPKGGGAGELRRISRMQKGLSEDKGPVRLFERVQEGGPERCRDFAGKYVSMLRFLAPGARRVVDKMPHNFTALGFIGVFFPNARIVHCKRNPADNFISAFQNSMNAGHSYAYAPEDYALYYKEYLRLMRHWHALLPGRIFDLQYEELVADPERKIRALLEFLGLPWDESCLRFHEQGAMVKTPSRQQVRAPINPGSVERWRNYERRMQGFVEILKDEMELLP